MSDSETLRIANEIIRPYGLIAKFIKDTYSVGVGGDRRTYTKALVVIGPWLKHEIISSLSTRISNMTSINRVTFELTNIKKVK